MRQIPAFDLARVVLINLFLSTMNKDKTQSNGGSAGLQPGAKFYPLLRKGPVIAIEVETRNIASPLRIQKQIDIVRDFSERLDAADIGYMLTGSMALNCYALPRVPRNLDFVIELRPENAMAMVRLFSPDYEISREAVDSAIAEQSFFNLFHRESRIRINGIVCQQTNYRRTEFSRRQHVKFESFKTWIASKEDLIISKLHWARKSRSPQHLRDIRNLAATGCDIEYIERWTRALGIYQLWQECSSV
jgi:hypothetical protein